MKRGAGIMMPQALIPARGRAAAAASLLALLLVSMIPVSGLLGLVAPAAAASATGSANATATMQAGGVNAAISLNVSGNMSIGEMRAKLILITGMIRGALKSLGLLGATPQQVAAALGINASAAEELLKLANLTPAKIAAMNEATLRQMLREALGLYQMVTEKIAAIAAKTRVMERTAERLRLEVAHRLAVLAEKLAEEANDTALLNLTRELMSAVRSGNTTLASKLMNQVLARIEADNLYKMSDTLAAAFSRLLEEMAKAGNATGVNQELIEKLLHDIKVAEKIAVRTAEKAAKAPDAAAKVLAAVNILSEVNDTAAVVAATGAGKAAVAAALEAMAARLEARISLDIQAAKAANNTEAYELLVKANATLMEVKTMLEYGDYVGATKLLTIANRLTLKAELLLALSQVRALEKELRARMQMPELLPVKTGRKFHILPVLPVLPLTVGKEKAEAGAAKAVEAVLERANETIVKTLALLEAVNKTVAETGVDGKVKRLLEEAASLVEEAKTRLAEAEKLLQEGNTAAALAKATAALQLAVKAEAYAHAALGAATAEAAAKGGIEEARKIRSMVRKQAEEIRKELEKAAKKAMEKVKEIVSGIIGKAKEKAEKAKEKAKEAKEKAKEEAEKAREKAGQKTAEVFNETVAERLNETLTQLYQSLGQVRLALAEAASLGSYKPTGVNLENLNKTVADVQEKVEKALEKLRESMEKAKEGDTAAAAELLQEAKELLREAMHDWGNVIRQLIYLAQDMQKTASEAGARVVKVYNHAEAVGETMRKAHQMAAELNMTVSLNTTAVEEAAKLLKQAELWLRHASNDLNHAMIEAVREGNVTRLVQDIVLIAESVKELTRAEHLYRIAANQTITTLDMEIKTLSRIVDAYKSLAGNISAVMQVAAAAGLGGSQAEITSRVTNALKILRVAEDRLVRAANELAKGDLGTATFYLGQANEMLKAVRMLLAPVMGDVKRVIAEARQQLSKEMTALQANITSLEAKIKSLRAAAAGNATLKAKLDKAEELLEEAKSYLGNATALLTGISSGASGQGKASGHAEASGASGGFAVEISVQVTALVQAKTMLDKAAELVKQAASLVSEVEAALQQAASPGTPSSPAPGQKPQPPKP